MAGGAIRFFFVCVHSDDDSQVDFCVPCLCLLAFAALGGVLGRVLW